MKLTPVEILKHLGFSVPEEGVEVHHDLFFHQSMLTLVGSTLNLGAISDDAIHRRHQGLIGVAKSWGSAVPPAASETPRNADFSRSSMAITLKQCYGFDVDGNHDENSTATSR